MKASHKQSAGLLLFRKRAGTVEVFLAHMGGPFWERKDEGAWSIPKGEFESEAPLAAALREFEEETGYKPNGNFIGLTPVKQSGGKTVYAWALEFDCDADQIHSNTFSMEWPKGSGKLCDFPEIDRAAWFSLAQARRKILKGQLGLLDQLEEKLSLPGSKAQDAAPQNKGPGAGQMSLW
jgi:predicted NUDIX family NTP pyrophosphohydrolase